MSRKPNTRLDDSMAEDQIADALHVLVFTASHNYERSVMMTEGARDKIVSALKRVWDLDQHGSEL